MTDEFLHLQTVTESIRIAAEPRHVWDAIIDPKAGEIWRNAHFNTDWQICAPIGRAQRGGCRPGLQSGRGRLQGDHRDGLLTDDEKVRACVIALVAGADFVKTSTGFASGGATAADVALMRRVVGPEMGVKAAGGVRDLKSAQEMLQAGADRIGASVGVKIVQESRGQKAAAPAAAGY